MASGFAAALTITALLTKGFVIAEGSYRNAEISHPEQDTMRNTLYLFCLLLAALAPLAAFATESQGQADQQQGWVVMPAGARPAYFGIHGGTMPVSLLVYGDGSSLVTFVGRTGNDFIDMLRRAEVSMPSLLNATSQRSSAGKSVTPSANATAVLYDSADKDIFSVAKHLGVEIRT